MRIRVLSVLPAILLLTTATAAAPDGVTQAARALDALVAHAEGAKPLSKEDAARHIRTVQTAVHNLPLDDTRLRPRLAELREQHADDLVPTAKRPLKRSNVLGRLLMGIDLDRLGRLPAHEVKAHPAAAAFPGAVPAGDPRVRRTLTIDTATPGWHSTGLYAAPGEVVTVTAPASAVGTDLFVRIGCHQDGLWRLDAWKRPPAICHHFRLSATETRAASAFGGPVYVEVPRGCTLGHVKVVLAGAVEMPYYVHGRTDPAAWRQSIRQRPAPWAELASEKIILTVPARVVRDLDDPAAVMTFWDAVADACADLSARPRDRDRPERYVADVQISAGYMHSGYPIMTLLDMPPVMVDVDRLKRNAHGGVWGLFHELGHNHQARDWTFRGTVEVTVNLFTMYVFETVCGLEPTRCHGSISDRSRARKMRAYLADPNFATWQRDPFLGLIMYIQMQKAFGWDAFKKVFAEYRALKKAERPRSDDAKRDQWLVRFSRTVGRDLGPFFAAWHVPVSDAAREKIAALPDWMPEGFPPK
ncbi:MAG: M60 family metallopeptidase [Planctomycetota bacterium]|nr:M60 family metallopeptidase [Planctomycetota bacterium]